MIKNIRDSCIIMQFYTIPEIQKVKLLSENRYSAFPGEGLRISEFYSFLSCHTILRSSLCA